MSCHLGHVLYITASTDIPTCAFSICQGHGTDINQIADGDTSNLNGFAGLDNTVGIITLDLAGNFDLDSFSLWKDINTNREGVGTFKLNFFDDLDSLIQSTSTLAAPSFLQGYTQTYSFDSIVEGVSKVEFETLTILEDGSAVELKFER